MSISTPKVKSPRRRNVRKKWQQGDLVSFETKSFTQDDETRYHPTIDLVTGESHCDCPTSVYRPTQVCKHRVRAALNLIRKGELDPAWLHRAGKKCCHACGTTEHIFQMAHDNGSPIENVFVCRPCLPQSHPLTPSSEEIAANAAIEPFDRINTEIDLLEDDIHIMEEIGFVGEELEEARATLQLAHKELQEVEIPRRFNPATYEEIRRHLQARLDQGEYVHANDWDRYQLVEPTI